MAKALKPIVSFSDAFENNEIIEGKTPGGALYHLIIDREGSAWLVDAGDCRREKESASP